MTKTCSTCGQEKPWAAFSGSVRVCSDCQGKLPGKTRVKVQAAHAPKLAEEAPETVIAHRRTGQVLLTHAARSLVGATLVRAQLAHADLSNATLSGADLHCTDLRLADLTGADLRSADLRGVNFRGADLRGADLREARLHRADLKGALYDGRTRWPQGFMALHSGAVMEA